MLQFTRFNVWFKAMVSVHLVGVQSADYLAVHNHHTSDHCAVSSCCVLIGRVTSFRPGQKPDESSCFVITTSRKFRGSQKVRKVYMADVVLLGENYVIKLSLLGRGPWLLHSKRNEDFILTSIAREGLPVTYLSSQKTEQKIAEAGWPVGDLGETYFFLITSIVIIVVNLLRMSCICFFYFSHAINQ